MLIDKDGCTCYDETTRACQVHGPWRCKKCGRVMQPEDYATTSNGVNRFCIKGGCCSN